MSDTKILSIIIPVRNWDLGLLLAALMSEIGSRGIEDCLEIIIVDDHSDEPYRRLNRSHVRMSGCISYYELPGQVGRAAIRNDLLARAEGQYILFLDADVVPDSSNFLESYFVCIRRGEEVVCGGISYRSRVLDDKKYDFYIYKGTRTEWLPAVTREKASWRYLFTANVLIRRSVLDQIGFDERFSGYGYEDIEWGIRLDRKVGIRHIDNTCSHLGLVEKQASLLRMRRSVQNFMLLQKLHPEVFKQADIASLVTLLSKLPVVLLSAMDKACGAVFACSPFHAISLFCFQLDKAVLFARAAREENNRDRPAAVSVRAKGKDV